MDSHFGKSLLICVLLCVSLTIGNQAEPVEYCRSNTTLEDFDRYLNNYIADSSNLVLLLDYDGTLAPIQPNPKTTVMRQETQEILKRLSKNDRIFMAVISGRAVDDVRQRVGLDDIVYGGNHGLEIAYPNGTNRNYKLAEDVARNYSKLLNELENVVQKYSNGAWVEDKIFSLTFHYRQVPSELQEDLKTKVEAIILNYGFRASPAHFAIEGKPPVEWHKGSAAELILRHEFGNNWKQQKILFAGDDTTDEDIMRLLKGFGISFRVAADPEVKTAADIIVPCTYSITTLLKWIEQRF